MAEGSRGREAWQGFPRCGGPLLRSQLNLGRGRVLESAYPRTRLTCTPRKAGLFSGGGFAGSANPAGSVGYSKVSTLPSSDEYPAGLSTGAHRKAGLSGRSNENAGHDWRLRQSLRGWRRGSQDLRGLQVVRFAYLPSRSAFSGGPLKSGGADVRDTFPRVHAGACWWGHARGMNGIKKYASQYKIKATGEVWEAVRFRSLGSANGMTIFMADGRRAVQLLDPRTLEVRTFLLDGLEPVDGRV